MRKLLLFVGTFVAMVLTLCAQEAISSTEYAELTIAPNAQKFSIELKTEGTNPALVDWGDGSPVEVKSPSSTGEAINLNHTFAAPSAEKRIIKIDATELTSIVIPSSEQQCIGMGTFVAPKLTHFDNGAYNNFKDSETDFSQCPNLTSLELNNLGAKARLCALPKLTRLTITSIVTDWNTYEVMSFTEWNELDLGLFPNLEKLSIDAQKIDKLIVPEGGMPALKSLEFQGNRTYLAENLRKLTESTKLTTLDLQANHLSFDLLPQRNPKVSYSSLISTGFDLYQDSIYVSEDAVNGRTVDLSYMMAIPRQFGEGDPVNTNIKWFYVDENATEDSKPIEVPADAYTIENGITTFKESAFKEGATEIKVYAKLSNELFPEISYEDDASLVPTYILSVTNTEPIYKGTLKFQKEYEEGDIKMMVFQKNGEDLEQLEPDAQVPVGTELLLAAGVENGSYTLKSFTVSYKKGETPATESLNLTDADKDEDGYYSKSFTSVEGDMEITLDYEVKELADYELTVTQPEHGLIELKDEDGNDIEAVEGVYKVKEDDLVYVRVDADEGYKVQSVAIGETVYNNANGNLELNEEGGTEIEYTVAGNAAMSAVLEAATASYAVTYSFPDEVAGKVTATVDGAAYESGKPVEAGKKVVFTYAKGDSKWAVESWTVDGKAVEGTKDKDTFELTVEKDAAVGMTLYNHAEQIADNQIAVRLINNGTILEVSGIAEGTQVSLYDAAGRELLSTTEHRINVTALAEGVYMVRALDQVVKVVK